MTSSNEEMKHQAYWDRRFADEDEYEWFADYAALRPLIGVRVAKTDRVLMLGCGNSSLSHAMCADGFACITNVDYSAVVIARMAQKHAACCSSQRWLVMDICDMRAIDEAEFDVVLEKGTFDTLLVGERDPWRLSADAERDLARACSEVSRVLTSSGKFVSVTFAQPHFRKRVVARAKYGWSVAVESVSSYAGCLEYFLYTMEKGERLSAVDAVFESKQTRDVAPAPCVACYDSEDDNDLLRIQL